MAVNIEKTNYYQYAADVISGKVVAGELIKLACKRFMSDLERDDLEFRADIVERFKQFAQLFKHFKGNAGGKPFVLEPWEEFFVANILGFYHRGTDLRRYTSALLCVSRKQGKSALCALITLWFLICDGEPSPEIALSANSRDQSSVLYDFVKVWAHQADPSGKDLKILRNGIECLPNNGRITVFAADATKLDGKNLSCFITDEYGGARTSEVYDVLRSSQGQRKNPLGIVITTCGFNLAGPFKKMYDMYCDILYGTKTDDVSFGLIFALDEGDDYTDEKVWPKIAPNLGVTVSEKYLREQVVYAKNNPSAEVGVLTKNFNMWCQTSETWIPDSYINKAMAKFDIEQFTEDNSICVGSFDLASVGDMTALNFMWVRDDDDKFYFHTIYYLPESALVESPNRELYKYWLRSGQLTITNGNVCDYDYILKDVMKFYNRFGVRRIGYDSWNSTSFVIDCTEQGLPLEPYSQSIGNFNKPTRELERLIRQGKAVIQNNEITRWMFRNVALKSDWSDNVKPVKSGGYANTKIDGVIAIIQSLGTYMEMPRFTGSILTL